MRPRPAPTRKESWGFPFQGLSIAQGGSSDRPTFWTRTFGDPPSVYGERLRFLSDSTWRLIDPTRSKLGAALCRGLTQLPLPSSAKVLYLGGASGTTASHVADAVGPRGTVYVVERSPRPFQRLLSVAERWPNLLPILADARLPRTYLPLVPPVNALYLDVAQPEQVDLALENARLLLRPGGGLLFALKGPSLRPGKGPQEQVREAIRTLSVSFDMAPPLSLEPFHRGHHFLTGVYRRE